jgi:hypothetical protein
MLPLLALWQKDGYPYRFCNTYAKKAEAELVLKCCWGENRFETSVVCHWGQRTDAEIMTAIENVQMALGYPNRKWQLRRKRLGIPNGELDWNYQKDAAKCTHNLELPE